MLSSSRLQDTALRYFLEVVRSGSVSEAAARLNVSPSAVSRQVAALEDLLGVPLFDRRPRGMAPSAAGELLAAHARRDLSRYYQLNAAIHRAINAAAKNPVLTSTYTQVNARLQALRFRSNQDGEKWSRAVQEHESMIKALQARDGAALARVLMAHLNNKRDVVLEVADSVLAARRVAASARGWKPLNRQRQVSYALRAYAMLATSADKGAVRNKAMLDGL